jgi:hypothetical protein
MIKTAQYNFDEATDMKFDAIIAASGYEKRCTYQSERLKGETDKRIILAFDKDLESSNRKKNDKTFKDLGFKIFRKDGQKIDLDFFSKLISDIICASSEDDVNIYVDYSSMTRNWYAQILWVASNIKTDKKIHIHFGYSFSKYEKNREKELLNRVVEPIFGFCNISLPSRPTALVICLGNEINRVYGLKEYFDAETYLFYSQPEYGNEFSKEVETLNQELIKEIKPENVFKFPIHDLVYAQHILESLSKVLVQDYRVIIAPCGPKPFTLISLINSLKFDTNIEVWRISPGEGIERSEREANGDVLVFKVTFTDNLPE